MKRNTMLKILNPVLAILLLNQLFSAAISDVIPKSVFEFLHEGGGSLLAIAAVLHLLLNWNWVKATYFKEPSKE